MPIFRALVCAAAAVLTLVAAAPAGAQTPGAVVQGRVTDALTSDTQTLAGATVRIEGTTLQAVTDRDGRFRIAGVPAGRQVLVISYLGRKDKAIEIRVDAGGTLNQAIAYDEPYTYNEHVTV